MSKTYKVFMTHTNGKKSITKSLDIYREDENVEQAKQEALDLACSSQVGLFKVWGPGSHKLVVSKVEEV